MVLQVLTAHDGQSFPSTRSLAEFDALPGLLALLAETTGLEADDILAFFEDGTELGTMTMLDRAAQYEPRSPEEAQTAEEPAGERICRLVVFSKRLLLRHPEDLAASMQLPLELPPAPPSLLPLFLDRDPFQPAAGSGHDETKDALGERRRTGAVHHASNVALHSAVHVHHLALRVALSTLTAYTNVQIEAAGPWIERMHGTLETEQDLLQQFQSNLDRIDRLSVLPVLLPPTAGAQSKKEGPRRLSSFVSKECMMAVGRTCTFLSQEHRAKLQEVADLIDDLNADVQSVATLTDDAIQSVEPSFVL